MITIKYDNFTEEIVETRDNAKYAILEAHAMGVGVDAIYNTKDDNIQYSLLWDVTLQEETDIH